jgi:hypothetical protein
VYAHQGATAAWQAAGDPVAKPGTYKLLEALADAGYVIGGSDMSSSAGPMGDPLSQARMANVDTWLKASTTSGGLGASASKARIWLGISQGATAILDYLGYDHNAGSHTGHMTDCAAIVLILPLIHLDSAYQNDTGGLRAGIGTAWGVTYPTALPSHADPLTNLATVAATTPPVRIYYASDDSIENSTFPASDLTSLGSNGSVINLGALGHTEAAIAAIDLPNLIAWLATVAAP